MNKSSITALAILLSTFASFPVLTRAQQSAVNSAPPREVMPYELMTANECFDMRQKMMVARTPEERFRLREQMYNELQKRAAAKGLVLRDRCPMVGRMGMKGPGHRGMYAQHPPLMK